MPGRLRQLYWPKTSLPRRMISDTLHRRGNPLGLGRPKILNIKYASANATAAGPIALQKQAANLFSHNQEGVATVPSEVRTRIIGIA